MSRYVNYELIFMRNGRAIKFNSSSLKEIQDVNQILIDISYDFSRLKKANRYKVNGRYYNLRYINGVIKVLNSYEGRDNRYFMADDMDVHVVDKEKLQSKLIFEDSDDYLERNKNRDIVLSMEKSVKGLPEIDRNYGNRQGLSSVETKDSFIRDDVEMDSLREESSFYSRGEESPVPMRDEIYSDRVDLEKNSVSPKRRSSQNSYDIENNYAHDTVQNKRAPRFYNDELENISNEYPRYINSPSLNSTTVFNKDIDDEDAATREKIIKLASYIDASSHRSLVFNDISTSIKTPKTIATETGLRPNYVSKVLKDFKGNGIVVCINEEARKGKLYELTELGLKIFNYLHRI